MNTDRPHRVLWTSLKPSMQYLVNPADGQVGIDYTGLNIYRGISELVESLLKLC